VSWAGLGGDGPNGRSLGEVRHVTGGAARASASHVEDGSKSWVRLTGARQHARSSAMVAHPMRFAACHGLALAADGRVGSVAGTARIDGLGGVEIRFGQCEVGPAVRRRRSRSRASRPRGGRG
jgi:hypothetical protein